MDLKRFISLSLTCLLTTTSASYIAMSHAQPSEPTRSSGFSSSLYEKAISAYEQGEINTAVIHVKSALSQDSNHLPARLLFGQILLEYGELSAAEDQYRVALSLNADRSIVVIPLAQTLLLQSKFSKILEEINIGPFSRDTNTQIYVYRGKANQGLGEFLDAQFSFEQALSIDDANINALLGLSSVHKKLGNGPMAKNYLMQAKAIAFDDPYVAFFEGEQLRQELNLAEALEAYNRAIGLKSDYSDAIRARASIHLDNNELTLAKKDIEFLLANTPEDPFAQLLHGVYLAKTSNSTEARNIIAKTSERFSQLEPETIEQFAPLALIYGYSQYLQGNFQNATVSLNGYLQKDPSSKQARELLAEIASTRGQFDLASDILQPIDASQYSERSAHLMLKALIETQQYNEALSLLTKLPSDIANTSNMKNWHAVVLVKSGKADQAIALLTENLNSAEALDKTQALMILGYNYLNLGLAKEALMVAQDLENHLFESNIEVNLAQLNFIASTHLVNLDDDNAQKYFEKALVLAPKNEIVNLNLAQLFIKNADYTPAQAILEGMLQENPNNTNALPIYAELLLKQNDYKNALTTLETFDELAPENLDNKYQLANAYLATNQSEKAIDIANDINRLESLSPFALIAKAKANLQLGNMQQAARSLRIAFGLYTEDPDKLAEIAKLQLRAQDFASVEKAIGTISAQEKNDKELHHLRVNLLSAQGKQAKALTLLNKQRNKDAQYYALKANLELQLMQDNAAVKSAQQAFKLAPNYQHHAILIRAYLITKQNELAYAQFNQWLENNPGDWETWRQLANLYEQHQLTEQAIESYRQAIEINQKDVFSLNNLANLYLEQRELSQALKLAKQAHEYAPLEAIVNDTYGWALSQNQQHNEAVPYFRESLARDNNNALTRFHLGMTLKELNRKDEALTQFYRALSAVQDDSLKQQIQHAIDNS